MNRKALKGIDCKKKHENIILKENRERVVMFSRRGQKYSAIFYVHIMSIVEFL